METTNKIKHLVDQKNLFWWIIFIVIICRLGIFLLNNQSYFTKAFDPKFYGDLYTQSQYVVGPRSVGGIGDDGLYAFAGYYYLFSGGDVSAVNFEHPPLGKYLIGFSILLFNNQNVINIIYLLCLLYLTYQIAVMLHKNRLTSLISIGILSSDLLILDNLIRSLLDLPFTLFFTAGVLFFLKAREKPKYYYLSSFFWGCAFSVRFFPAIIIVLTFLLLMVYIYSKNNIFIYLRSLFLIPAIYLLCHFSFFIYHPSILEFLRHKRWMISWFQGTVIVTGNILRNIYSGQYIDSTGKIATNNFWNIILPVTFTSSFMSLSSEQFKKQGKVYFPIFGLTLIYTVYTVFLTNGVQKFIMPVYPLICILSGAFFEAIYSIIIKWMRTTMKK